MIPLEGPAVAKASTVERTHPKSHGQLVYCCVTQVIPFQKYLAVDPCTPSYFCDLMSVTTVGMTVLAHALREAEIHSLLGFAINLNMDLR